MLSSSDIERPSKFIIPIDKSIPGFEDTNIDLPTFLLKARRISPRQSFFNLCLLIVISNNKDNIFNKLPVDILIMLGKYMEVTNSYNELKDLLHTCFDNRELIIKMNSTPGGISIYQHKRNNGKTLFTLFKSPFILCKDYLYLKENLRKKQRKSILDYTLFKEFTNESMKSILAFRAYANQCLNNCLTLFGNSSYNRELVGWIKQSHLYAESISSEIIKLNNIKA